MLRALLQSDKSDFVLDPRSLATESAILALATVVFYVTGLAFYRLWLHPLSKYPGPLLARLTSLHSVFHIVRGDRHLAIYAAHQHYGDFVRIAPNLISINNAAAIKEVYRVGSNVKKGQLYVAAARLSQSSSTFSTVDKHTHGQKRRTLAPAFTAGSVDAMQEYILEHIRTFTQRLANDKAHPTSSGYFNIAKWANYLTFDVMGDIAFGKGFNMLSDNALHSVPKMIDQSLHRQLLVGSSGFVSRLGMDRFLCPGISTGANDLLSFAKKQVSERSQKNEGRRDFMAYLLGAKTKEGLPAYDAASTISEARTLIVAGSDTTATQIAAGLFYLSLDVISQNRLAKEVQSQFSSVEDIRLGDALDRCHFLKAYAEETLRMSPSVPGLLPREVLPGGIDILGDHFPPGVEVAVPIWALHHDSRYYDDPHRHRPQRWLEDECGEEAVRQCWYAFHPFSYGTRQCLGMKVAYSQIWITLARIAFLFEVVYEGGGMEDRFDLDTVQYKLLDHMAAGRDGPILTFRLRSEAGKVATPECTDI